MHGEMRLFAVHGHHDCARSGSDKVHEKRTKTKARGQVLPPPLLASCSSRAGGCGSARLLMVQRRCPQCVCVRLCLALLCVDEERSYT